MLYSDLSIYYIISYKYIYTLLYISALLLFIGDREDDRDEEMMIILWDGWIIVYYYTWYNIIAIQLYTLLEESLESRVLEYNV